MEIFVYRNKSDKVEVHYEVELIPELLRDENVIFWVDFEAPNEADDQDTFGRIQVPPLDC